APGTEDEIRLGVLERIAVVKRQRELLYWWRLRQTCLQRETAPTGNGERSGARERPFPEDDGGQAGMAVGHRSRLRAHATGVSLEQSVDPPLGRRKADRQAHRTPPGP